MYHWFDISMLVDYYSRRIPFFPCSSLRLFMLQFLNAKKRCSVRLYSHLFCSRFKLCLCYLYLVTHTGVLHDFHDYTNDTGTAYRSGHLCSSPIFSGVCVARSLIYCVVYCSSMFVLFSFFFLPLHYLSFFELRLLMTP